MSDNKTFSEKTMWIQSIYYGIIILVIILSIMGIATVLGERTSDLYMVRVLLLFLPLIGIISFQVGYERASKKGSADE